MIKRTSLNFVNAILNKNPKWKILDIGCGYSANKRATVLADINDLSEFYKNRKFVRIKSRTPLPFKNKEFDFIIASHVIEHIDDIQFFIKELERISNKGYIELPTRLGDNLVYENVTDHIWWFIFDDINNQLIASKKNQLIEPFVTVSMSKRFDQAFRESFVLELAWEDKIDFIIKDSIGDKNFEKINFFKIFKKHISKKFRTMIRRK